MKNFLFFSLLFLFSCQTEWSYEGKGAPQYWGDLKEEYKFCKIGYNQSPIDIKNEFTDSDLTFNYRAEEIEKTKDNYVINFEFDEPAYLLRKKKKYLLRKMHFHHPSEHQIKGEKHSLELQISHKSEDEQWLNLAVFFEVGKENAEINKLITLLENKDSKANIKFDLNKIIQANDQVFFYEGSSTTPPCKEGVKWYVLKTTLEMSKEQMNKIIKLSILTKSNARPIQEFHPEAF